MSDHYLQFLATSIQSVISPMRSYLLDLHEQYHGMTEGTLANSTDTSMTPQTFGICAVSVDQGQVYEVGDSTQPFVMQSLSRGLIYGLVLEDWGREWVSQYIGMKPTDEVSNTITLDESSQRPHNPLITTGAIATTSMIQGSTVTERLQRIMQMMRRYAGRDLQISVPTLLAMKEQGYRERAIACFLQQFGLLHAGFDPVLELFFHHSAILVNSRDVAMIAATLANGGINPITGEQAIAAAYVPDVTSVLLTCGMGARSGEWTYQVGMPAQSSMGGGVMAIVPQELGLGVFSPLLDREGRSYRGMRVCESLSKEQRLHLFDIYEKNQTMQKYIEQVEKITTAAAALENNEPLDLQSLDEVKQRTDELGQLARVFTNMVRTVKTREQQLEQMVNAFGRFVPHEFLKFLQRESILDVQLGDHVSKEMAVMFSDIRSFTALSECMTPQETFDFVNDYLRCVSPEIRGHNGFVVKFLGDGTMAVFPEGADDAVAAGIAQFEKIAEFNRERQSCGHLPICVGMGIHLGNMMLGIVGEHDRIQGDTLSDTVNLTARLEGLTKYYGIPMAISGEILQRLSHPENYQLRFIDRAIVKGRTEAIAIYEVLDVQEEAIQELKRGTLNEFNQGLECYCNGKMQQATACFDQVLKVNPLDGIAKRYIERIEELTIQGIPKDWQGIWTFTQK
jgi:glutaminase/class 3 adenylate cyclase